MEVNSHCQGGGWNKGGNLGWSTGGEDGAPTACGGCGLIIPQAALVTWEGPGLLLLSIRHSEPWNEARQAWPGAPSLQFRLAVTHLTLHPSSDPTFCF